MVANIKDYRLKFNIYHLIGYLLISFLLICASLASYKIYDNDRKSKILSRTLLEQELLTLNTATLYLKQKEGFKAVPYLCSAGTKTIGYGDTDYLKKFPSTSSITLYQASAQLTSKVRAIKATIEHYTVTVGEQQLTYAESLHPRQKAALISFIYNLGDSAYRHSTLRDRIDQGIVIEAKLKLNNARDTKYHSRLLKELQHTKVFIQAEFIKWSRIKSGANYTQLASLVKRRGEEAQMFLTAN